MSKCIYYYDHHIIPRYILKKLGLPENWMGKDNLISLTAEEHSYAHHDRWKRFGQRQDELAWKGAAGIMSKEEIIKALQHMPKSEETKRKISEAKMGNTNMLGKKHSPESRQQMSEVKMGKKASPETRAKMVENSYWKGTERPPFTEEHRQKLSEGQAGLKRGPYTEEHKRKISEANTGKKRTAETKKKISEVMRGKKRGPYKKKIA